MAIFVEYALGKGRRNYFTDIAKFNIYAKDRAEKAHKDDELYRSLFLYPADEVTDHLRKSNNMIRRYEGNIIPSHVMIDVDGVGHDPKKAKKRIEDLTSRLHSAAAVPPECVQYFFSGRGIHAMIHRDIFGLKMSPRLHKVVKHIVDSILMGFDAYDDIYNRTSIFRWPNSYNRAANCFKIPITFQELMTYDYDHLFKLAQQPRLDFDYATFQESGDFHNLSDYTAEAEAHTFREENFKQLTGKYDPTKEDPISINKRKLTCIHHIVDRGPTEGTRHYDMGTISCAFARQGIPLMAATVFLQAWIRQGDGKLRDNTTKYHDGYIAEQVRYWYKGGYRPSCTGDNHYSRQMQRYCDPECMFYQKKNLNQGLMTSDEGFALLEKRLKMEKDGAYINLTQLLAPGDEGPQCKNYPGQLVTFMGPTSVGKTALVMWLVTQVHMGVAYLTLEMGGGSMMKRFAQMVLGCGEGILDELYVKYKEQIREALSHINMTTMSMNPDEMSNLLSEIGLKFAVIDHLGLMNASSSDPRKKTLELTNKFRNQVVNHETIYWAISHIRREDARDGVVDLYSGKESGSIENDSHIVVGIEQDKKDPDIIWAKIMKNTEGPRDMAYPLVFNRDTSVFAPANKKGLVYNG
jgi:hypothetical protein